MNCSKGHIMLRMYVRPKGKYESTDIHLCPKCREFYMAKVIKEKIRRTNAIKT